MSERLEFVQACLNRREKIETICDRFGVSEKTGHKWLAEFRKGGEAALEDRSRAPHASPRRLAPELASPIITLRKQHPLWGPEKLRDCLLQRAPELPWPAISTFGALLKREGLIAPKRRRARAHAHLESGRTAATAPNVVWTADFKGQSRLAHGPQCYPLTILDLHTHFLLRCTGLASTAVLPAQRVFTALFREYGLPEVLRTDNGVPFAQPNAIGRLGRLGFWLVRLDIRPEHTKPATPSENGAHERFHKTLKAHTIQPPAASLAAQQRRFDHFQQEYNHERPHAATQGHLPPAHAYTASPRSFPRRLPALEYGGSSGVRRVDKAGNIKWRGSPIFLSLNLYGQDVGMFEVDDALVQVRYGRLQLGHFDLHLSRFAPHVVWVAD